MAANPTAGWYPDPNNADQERLWNGDSWAGDTRPKLPPDPTPAPPSAPAPPAPVATPVPPAAPSTPAAPLLDPLVAPAHAPPSPGPTPVAAQAEESTDSVSRRDRRKAKKAAKHQDNEAAADPSMPAVENTETSDASALRPDIEKAKKAMTIRLGSGREIRKLIQYISDQETVECFASGTYGGGQGLLALTTARLIFLKDGMTRKTLEDFPVSKISSVQWSAGMLTGELLVFTSGNKAEISNINKNDGKLLADRLRDLISDSAITSSHPEPSAAPPQTGVSVADELVKLAALRDAGVLSPEEFSAQKARLLS